MKKRIKVVDSLSSFESEVSLPLLKEELYIMLEVTPKNGRWLVHFVKAKRQVPNSTIIEIVSEITIIYPHPTNIFLCFFLYACQYLILMETLKVGGGHVEHLID